MIRTLPTAARAARILAETRTRPPQRPPPPIAKSLTATFKALDGRFGHGAEGLKARWSEIVGARLARHTEPVRLTNPKSGGASLEIRVAGPSATLVQHQAPEILTRVNLFLGAGAVEKLRIVQGPLRRVAREPAPVRRSGPLDAAAEQALAAPLSGLTDSRLKTALIGLGREVMRGKR
jgi:hypothetical protein